ncbi:MAG: hypothetical protein KF764_00130 [Labilithrix sp.]|nr:hypothetical protein [Labilithrix sp.]
MKSVLVPSSHRSEIGSPVPAGSKSSVTGPRTMPPASASALPVSVPLSDGAPSSSDGAEPSREPSVVLASGTASTPVPSSSPHARYAPAGAMTSNARSSDRWRRISEA